MSTEAEYDVIVVGAGAGGLTAARELAAHGLRVLALDRIGVGGQVLSVEGIINFPGYDEIAGYDLGAELMMAAEDAGAEVMLTEANSLATNPAGFGLQTSQGEFQARAVVIAVGSERKTLGVPGEDRFQGLGISHCASCDGPFFKEQRVAVVGGGDSAFDEAAVLAKSAAQVTIFHTGATPAAKGAIINSALANKNIEVVPHASVTEIVGGDRVTSISVRDEASGDQKEMPVDGVFVYIGLLPNTDWLSGLATLDEDNRIVTDQRLMTTAPGLFAVGDVRSGTASLLSEAASDGQLAAESVASYLASAATGPTSTGSRNRG